MRSVEEFIDDLEGGETNLCMVLLQFNHQDVIGMLHIDVGLPENEETIKILLNCAAKDVSQLAYIVDMV